MSDLNRRQRALVWISQPDPHENATASIERGKLFFYEGLAYCLVMCPLLLVIAIGSGFSLIVCTIYALVGLFITPLCIVFIVVMNFLLSLPRKALHSILALRP